MSTKSTSIMMVASVLTLVCATPAIAHHSYAMFDRDKVQAVIGTLYAIEWKNPHSWIWVMGKDPSGKPQLYGIEGGSPAALTRMGYSRKSFVVGTKVTVEFNPLRDGRAGGNLVKLTAP